MTSSQAQNRRRVTYNTTNDVNPVNVPFEMTEIRLLDRILAEKSSTVNALNPGVSASC